MDKKKIEEIYKEYMNWLNPDGFWPTVDLERIDFNKEGGHEQALKVITTINRGLADCQNEIDAWEEL